MDRYIAITATLDTKDKEVAYLKQVLQEKGIKTIVIDVGVFPPQNIVPDIDRVEIASLGGYRLNELKNKRRDEIMRGMGEGLKNCLLKLYSTGKIGGALGVGGNQGTAITSIGFRALPFGFPKIIVSTVASGDIRPYIGHKDIAVMFSVADLLGGVNSIIKPVLDNAAAAVAGMLKEENTIPKVSDKKGRIAVTAFGNTHNAVINVKKLLEDADYEVVPFHASGASGSAMEELINEGYFSGVIDITTHELVGEVLGHDIYTPVVPGRLEAAGKKGIPQVIVPGGLNYYCFGPPDSIPEFLRHRAIHYHNPYNTNVKTSPEELKKIAEVMAKKLNSSNGPVAVAIPQKGWSENAREGNPLYDPKADRGFVTSLKEFLREDIRLIEEDAHINDPQFANTLVELLFSMLKKN